MANFAEQLFENTDWDSTRSVIETRNTAAEEILNGELYARTNDLGLFTLALGIDTSAIQAQQSLTWEAKLFKVDRASYAGEIEGVLKCIISPVSLLFATRNSDQAVGYGRYSIKAKYTFPQK